MRKMRLFLAAATFCSAMAVGYSAYTNATMTEQERLMLANIEALSDGTDGGEGGSKQCRWSRVFDSFGCAYHNCVVNGDGNLCSCGDTKG